MRVKRLVLIVPGDVNTGSPNRRYHWRTAATLKKRWTAAATMAWRAAGSPWVGERVRLTFTVRRARALDPGNALRSLCLVAIENGLKKRAFVDDDLLHLCYGELIQEVDKKFKGFEEVQVLIERVEG